MWFGLTWGCCDVRVRVGVDRFGGFVVGVDLTMVFRLLFIYDHHMCVPSVNPAISVPKEADVAVWTLAR